MTGPDVALPVFRAVEAKDRPRGHRGRLLDLLCDGSSGNGCERRASWICACKVAQCDGCAGVHKCEPVEDTPLVAKVAPF